MDRSIPTLIFIAIVILMVLVGRFMYWRRMRGSIDWPETEATIQSGDTELVRYGMINERLPFFDFSYMISGEVCSGRFGLRVTEDRTDTLTRDLIGTKITIGY